MANTKKKKVKECTAEEHLITKTNIFGLEGDCIGLEEHEEVYDAAEKFYRDVFPANHKSPNVEKIQKPVFSQKYIRESIDKKEDRRVL